MSYSRSYSAQIPVHYSGSKSYPASQSGGVVHYSGTTYETVNVNIHVDTDAFDLEVDGCRNTVDALTGSVVATQAAHVATIAQKAKQVGQTIVTGFFKTVASEISQQTAELRAKVESHLTHLASMKQRLDEKQQQMDTDYHRLTGRYMKLFSELDHELETRVKALDQPVFRFETTSTASTSNEQKNSLIGISAAAAAETSALNAQITAAMAKRRAASTMEEMRRYLEQSRRNDVLIKECLLPQDVAATYYVPVIEYSAVEPANTSVTRLFVPECISSADASQLKERVADGNPSVMTPADQRQLADAFMNEVKSQFDTIAAQNGGKLSGADERIRNLILTLFRKSNL